ncbi:hypothetical protein QCA50_007487 [Cerrena zonata]|uniref:Putative peroxiredoxin n=1 Tax=Cerrena zonata TaxID=2478898 RepID=A0AAW0GB47_9APHY
MFDEEQTQVTISLPCVQFDFRPFPVLHSEGFGLCTCTHYVFRFLWHHTKLIAFSFHAHHPRCPPLTLVVRAVLVRWEFSNPLPLPLESCNHALRISPNHFIHTLIDKTPSHPTPIVKVGDVIPSGTFSYVPYTPETDSLTACGIPVKYSTDEWKGKKIVLFSVPGAFTPTCHVNHLPPYLEKFDEFKGKGVDLIAVIAANDPFVMSGWAKAFGLKDKIVALSDPDTNWSKQLGLTVDLSGAGIGLGTRTARFALIIDDLKITYLGLEKEKAVTVSGADAVLAAL